MNTAFGGHIPSKMARHDASGRARSGGVTRLHLSFDTANAYLQHIGEFLVQSQTGYQWRDIA